MKNKNLLKAPGNNGEGLQPPPPNNPFSFSGNTWINMTGKKRMYNEINSHHKHHNKEQEDFIKNKVLI